MMKATAAGGCAVLEVAKMLSVLLAMEAAIAMTKLSISVVSLFVPLCG